MAIIITLTTMIALGRGGQVLRGGPAPLGIISFELAGNTESARQMVASWNTQQRIAAGINLGLDYLFLFAYPLAIGLGCALVAEAFAARERGMAAIGFMLAWLQPLAGLLDAVENYALIRILYEPALPNWALVSTVCAIPKFAIVGVGLVYFFFGGPSVALRRARQNA